MPHDANDTVEVRVRDVMVAEPIAVEPTEPLQDVIRLMTSRKIGAVLVGVNGAVDGIFTERDLLRYAAEAPHGWRQRPVSDWMTRDLCTISADSGWEEAVALMERAHVRHLPVVENGRLVGLVTARNLIARRTEHLDQQVQQRTRELEALTAQLLDRDRQSQRNLKVAGRLLNRLLLPHEPPTWKVWSWSVHFRPLDPLGGDYYDFATPDDEHLGILIADASGHSLPAAMVAIMARIAFAEVSRTTTRPADVLAAMNRHLQGMTEERFVTAFYGIVHRSSGKFTFANAGHPAPLHWAAAERTVRPLGAVGFMLGIVPDAVYDEQTVELGAGDRLCFYTDGAPESHNPGGEAFGAQRLESELLAHGAEQADKIRDAIVHAIVAFRGERPADDDCTILIAAHR